MNPNREKGLSFSQVTAGVKPVAFATAILRLFQRIGHLLSLVEQAGGYVDGEPQDRRIEQKTDQ